MEISFLGHSSFRIKGKKCSVITDPFDPQMVGLKFPKVSADVVTISHQHKDHANYSLVQNLKKVLDGPGEYEIAGVTFIAESTYHDNKKGEQRGKNTIFMIQIDNISLVHLGDLGHKLSEKLIETIGEVDILFIPVGGEYTIGPKEAIEIVQDLDPKIIIPMHYQMEGLNKEVFSKLESVSEFTKAVGLKVEKMSKLKIKKENLPTEQTVVVLSKS